MNTDSGSHSRKILESKKFDSTRRKGALFYNKTSDA